MINIFIEFSNTYIESYEGIATVLIILVIILKLLINQKVTRLHLKRMFVSIPSEITFLLIGFLISAIVTDTEQKNLKMLIVNVLWALIVLVIQYALERFLYNKLSENNWKLLLCVGFMYAASFILYNNIVFGGIY